MIKNSWLPAVGFQMWTCMCEHSCHKGLWVSINSQPEGSLLKGITLDVNYPWRPHISFHTVFPPKSNEAAAFPKAVNFTGSGSPRDMCFLSTNSLQLSFLDHAALISQLIDCWRLTWNNESAVSVPYELLTPHFLNSVQFRNIAFICILVWTGTLWCIQHLVCLSFPTQRQVQLYF